MTEVRIRHEHAVTSAHLGDVPLGQVDDVIPKLDRWGGVSVDGGVHTSLFAQFVLDTKTDQAYFEVVIAPEGEA